MVGKNHKGFRMVGEVWGNPFSHSEGLRPGDTASYVSPIKCKRGNPETLRREPMWPVYTSEEANSLVPHHSRAHRQMTQ